MSKSRVSSCKLRRATAFAILAVSAGFCVAPDSRAGVNLPRRAFRLDNGLHVVLQPDPAAPRIAINLCYKVGSRDEQPGRTGVAHLLEHLMFEGTEHVPPGAFDRWLERAGGTGNAATAEDWTAFWMEIPAEALELALFLESDRMGWLLGGLDDDLLAAQKEVISREREQLYGISLESSPDWRSARALYPPAHRFATPVIGAPDDLAGLKLADVAAFQARHYRPGGASLVVAGPIDLDVTEALVRKWFGEIPSSPVAPSPPIPAATLAEERRIVVESEGAGAGIRLVWPSAPAMSDEDAALVILADLLTGEPSARLSAALLDGSGTVVAVTAEQQGLESGGLFSIEITLGPEIRHSEILERVDRVVADLARREIPRKEFRRSVAGQTTRLLTGAERLGGFDGRAHRMNLCWVYTGETDCLGSSVERLERLTPTDVRRATARRLGRGRVVLFHGPAEASPSNPGRTGR